MNSDYQNVFNFFENFFLTDSELFYFPILVAELSISGFWNFRFPESVPLIFGFAAFWILISTAFKFWFSIRLSSFLWPTVSGFRNLIFGFCMLQNQYVPDASLHKECRSQMDRCMSLHMDYSSNGNDISPFFLV